MFVSGAPLRHGQLTSLLAVGLGPRPEASLLTDALLIAHKLVASVTGVDGAVTVIPA